VSSRVTGPRDAIGSEVVGLIPELILCPVLRDGCPVRCGATTGRSSSPRAEGGSWSLLAGLGDHGRTSLVVVTGLRAVDELDAGSIWATRTFDQHGLEEPPPEPSPSAPAATEQALP
jgi:putative two-component system hydrogenase maturation factor HypX/HoxX